MRRHIAVIIISAIFVAAFVPVINCGNPTSENSYKTALQDSVFKKGKEVFIKYCSACHKDSVGIPAPGYSILTIMTPQAVLASLNTGKMRLQAANLSEYERRAVSQFITNRVLAADTFSKEAYTSFSLPAKSPSPYDHSGWGNNLEATGFRSSEQAGINPANVSSLTLKWAFAFPGGTVTRSKPAVVGDWLIVGGQFGEVYALNRHTGKTGWKFAASSAIRGAIAVTYEGNSVTAYFADNITNVYALDVRTGKQLWVQRAALDANSSVTGSVAVYNGKVYVPLSSIEVATAVNGKYPCCSSSGGVAALDARTGKILWTHRVVPPAKQSGKKKNGEPLYGPSGAPVWSSPTIDAKRGLLYIGTGENYSYPTTNSSDAIQALDLETGKLVWNFQATKDDAYNLACPVFVNCPEKQGPDLDFGMAPLLVKQPDGNDILLVGQKSGVVFALTPEGRVLWQTRIGKGGMLGGIHWGMATDGRYVYAANADNIIAIDNRDNSIKPSPGLYAIDITNGKITWKTPSPESSGTPAWFHANSAAPLLIPGIVFAGTLDGHIRAYSSTDGKILWDYNTAKEYKTTSNGIEGRGGAIDGPPPVVCDGMLFVNSGYGMFGEMPGNVLLAFEVKK